MRAEAVPIAGMGRLGSTVLICMPPRQSRPGMLRLAPRRERSKREVGRDGGKGTCVVQGHSLAGRLGEGWGHSMRARYGPAAAGRLAELEGARAEMPAPLGRQYLRRTPR